MALDIENFLQVYHIPYLSRGHKHTRHGWVQIKCPFCFGGDGWHLGYSQADDWWNCWRCGYHKGYDVLLNLLNNDKSEVRRVLEEFKAFTPKDEEYKPTNTKLVLPYGLTDLTKRARKYCVSRRYNPDTLIREWDVKSTDTIGPYKYRLFIPVTYNNRVVSFQCRDITGLADMKYLGASQDEALMNYKTTLYGLDKTKGDACVVVEGIFDAWRFGYGAVATFGIKFTDAQILTIAQRFKQAHIVYDGEEVAQFQAEKMSNALGMLGVDAKIWILDEGDPDDLDQKEATKFMDDVLGRSRYKLL